ncbi:Rieske Fe-S protein [Saccharomonospora amisosensis]|uniref:Cytochrome bc1 complex Rieske iron-sulfur subunit n=1 Tax=Saccharomonospora amisosensis TaxID=1128677 RepID=A0A7X5ZQV9_9PSEU|nr:Rieske Fe-S protein [Saccharomonospora amisosensis]
MATAAVGGAALAACGGEQGGPTSGGGEQQPTAGGQPGQNLTSLSDVPVGGATAVTTPDGQDAVVSRPSANEVAAFSAICTHQGCKVDPQGAELRCPCHGSVFDAFTGEVRRGPADQPLPEINVRVDNGRIVTA